MYKINDFFDSSSVSINDHSLHYYENNESSYIPIKYTVILENSFSDSIEKTFLLKMDENKNHEEIISEKDVDVLPLPTSSILNEIKMKLEKDRNTIVTNTNITPIKRESVLWTTKYLPKKFDELLSDDKINREVLCWLKAWDTIVFPGKKKTIPFLNSLYFQKKVYSPWKLKSPGKNIDTPNENPIFNKNNNNYHNNNNYNNNNSNNNNNNNNNNNFNAAKQFKKTTNYINYDLDDAKSMDILRNHVFLKNFLLHILKKNLSFIWKHFLKLFFF